MNTPELIAKLEELKVGHTTCQDCWYSCPQSGECCDDRQTGCTCGADAHNARVDLLIAQVKAETLYTGKDSET